MTEHKIFIVDDFDEWKHAFKQHQPVGMPSDEFIFPTEIIEYVKGYMISPIASNGVTSLSASSRKGSSLADAIEYIKLESSKYDVYVYQIIRRNMIIDGHEINSIIIRLATTDKS